MLWLIIGMLFVMIQGCATCRSTPNVCVKEETEVYPSLLLTVKQVEILYEFALSLRELSCQERENIIYSTTDAKITLSKTQIDALLRVYPNYFKEENQTVDEACKPYNSTTSCKVTVNKLHAQVPVFVCSVIKMTNVFYFAFDVGGNIVHVVQIKYQSEGLSGYDQIQVFSQYKCSRSTCEMGLACNCGNKLINTARAIVTYPGDPTFYECDIQLPGCAAYV